MAASGLSWASDIPEGFANSALVPYDSTARMLYKNATVTHLSNKYCAHRDYLGLCSQPLESFIVE